MKKNLRAVAITGPTASGKTSLSVALAKAINAEIISCDSQQIYRYMNIGTAKVRPDETAGIKHYLVDVIDPDQSFSAMQYKAAALDAAREINSKGKIPFFVGGTGLYLETAVRGEYQEPPESDPSYREQIQPKGDTEEERIILHNRLKAVDPYSAEVTHYNNVRRVIRALEIYDKTGKPKSYFDEISKSAEPDIILCHVTLDFHNRETLYERINERVDLMMSEGLIDEVLGLIDKGYLTSDTTAAGAIGYKEVIEGLKEGLSVEEIKEKIKIASRNYAKRQLTWFRHRSGVKTIFIDDEDGKLREKENISEEISAIFKEFLNN